MSHPRHLQPFGFIVKRGGEGEETLKDVVDGEVGSSADEQAFWFGVVGGRGG